MGQILLLLLLPNPPWVVLLGEGLECLAACSAAQPREQEVPASECRSGDTGNAWVDSWRQTASTELEKQKSVLKVQAQEGAFALILSPASKICKSVADRATWGCRTAELCRLYRW